VPINTKYNPISRFSCKIVQNSCDSLDRTQNSFILLILPNPLLTSRQPYPEAHSGPSLAPLSQLLPLSRRWIASSPQSCPVSPLLLRSDKSASPNLQAFNTQKLKSFNTTISRITASLCQHFCQHLSTFIGQKPMKKALPLLTVPYHNLHKSVCLWVLHRKWWRCRESNPGPSVSKIKRLHA